MNAENKVGVRISAYREKLGMSIADLAERSSVSEIAIAALESGETLPAIGPLTRIARALGQRLGTFMDDQFKPDPIVVRAGEKSLSLAAGKPDRHMDPSRVVLPANASHDPVSFEGEAFVVCFDGEVELIYGGERTVLEPGDSAFFNSIVKHTWRAIGGQPATVYAVIYQPA